MTHHVHQTRRLLNSLESDRRKEGVTRDLSGCQKERQFGWQESIIVIKTEKSAGARDLKTRNVINELPHECYT